MTRAELQRIKPLVEQIVENKLAEILGDPDSDLELEPNIRQRLKNALHSKANEISVGKAVKKLGLHW